jgi:hypothetical protein
MRTISFAGLCLVSAMVALAQSPDRPSLLVHWPADAPIIEPAAPDLAAIPSATAAAASQVGTALAAGIPAGVEAADLVVRLDLAADDPPVGPILAADVMRSLPSGMATHIPPRRAAWPRPPHAIGCPFTSAKACAMWHAGR